jgi:hypothetical protein
MALKNVIPVDTVVQAINEHLNNDSKLAFINAVVNAAQNRFNELSSELQTAVANLQNQLNVVMQKADILESLELGQVEEALKELLQNLDTEGLFSTLCVDINGQKFKLYSVVQALVSADKIAKVDFNWDASNENLASVTFTLDDGTVVTLNGTANDITDESDNVTGKEFVFSTDNWKGLHAEFSCKFKKVADTYSVLGENVEHDEWLPVEQTNIVFDLTVQPCTPATPESITPDLNEDGTIGTGETGTT